MSDTSKIEWTDATWNPVTGCSKVSQGCKNCYALRDWPRLSANRKSVYYRRAFTDVQCHPSRLEAPLHWTKPRRIFVNSMSDLFHEAVPDDFILQVFEVMRQCANGYSSRLDRLATAHTFQILTKRAARMHDFCSRLRFDGQDSGKSLYLGKRDDRAFNPMRALHNVWLGVSVEDQATADERIPLLLQTPAAVRFISAEPLLGPIDLYSDAAKNLRKEALAAGIHLPALSWVIAGGESGPNARPSHPDWFRALRNRCAEHDTPFFFKQWGQWAPCVFEDRDAVVSQTGGTWPRDTNPVEDDMRNAIRNGGICMQRLHKKSAGRELDGRTHDEYPA